MKTALSAAALLAMALFAPGANAQYSVPDKTTSDQWQQTFHLYGMAARINGDTQLGNLSVPISISISELLDALRMGGMAAYRVENGDWSFSADATYMDLGWRASTRGSRAGARLGMEQFTFMVTAGKRIGEHTEILGSLAYFDLSTDLRVSVLQQSLTASRNASWVDPLIGIQHTVPLSDKWSLNLRGDVGGFGINSDFTWQAWAVARREVSERFSWFVGYRALGYDYQSGSGMNFQRYDLVQQGPGAGVSFSF